MFETELMMHHYFGKFLDKNICTKKVGYDYEVEHLFGIPDYVLFEKTEKNLKYVIGIELKLRDWKRGIIQAFRYKNFSNSVFVVLDEKNIRPALKQIKDFERYNVGLASFSSENIFKVFFNPTPEKPHSKFYTKNLKKELEKKFKIEEGDLNFKLLEKKSSNVLMRKIKKITVN